MSESKTIYSFKLVTGEEIIAEVLSVEADFIYISKPVITIMTENPNNPAQTNIMFAPWMVSTSLNQMEIKTKFIVYSGESSDEAAASYIEATKNL